MTKFLPPDKAVDALLVGGEERALEHQNKRLEEAGQRLVKLPHSLEAFFFRRGFEYGVQWALDNAEWLSRYTNHSHSLEQDAPYRKITPNPNDAPDAPLQPMLDRP